MREEATMILELVREKNAIRILSRNNHKTYCLGGSAIKRRRRMTWLLLDLHSVFLLVLLFFSEKGLSFYSSKTTTKRLFVSWFGSRDSISSSSVLTTSLNNNTNSTTKRSNNSSTTTITLSEGQYQPLQQAQATSVPILKDTTSDAAVVNTTNVATLLIYQDPSNNVTLYGLNLPTTVQFIAWVQYKLNATLFGSSICKNNISKQQILLDEKRDQIRSFWKQGILLSHQTEPLATYVSDMEEKTRPAANSQQPTTTKQQSKNKRGGFRDLLSIYADRLLSIVQDECEDSSTTSSLLHWMQQEYGVENLARISSLSTASTTETQQMEELQRFLDWFRLRFPYYYDRCDVCGSSEREEKLKSSITNCTQVEPPTIDTNVENNNTLQTEDDEVSSSSFLGYVYPNEEELIGKASRTELYFCRNCKSWTRFPRYNSASFILSLQKGRCGEYSMLLYRMLRVLGYKARWVVDWCDHVWCEVQLSSSKKWIHLDPCEAAVNKPLLYQEWGKEQTYIYAFHATTEKLDEELNIEDVTSMYTSDSLETIWNRREEPAKHIESSLKEVQNILWKKLKRHYDLHYSTQRQHVD